jgi:hypothetical protein
VIHFVIFYAVQFLKDELTKIIASPGVTASTAGLIFYKGSGSLIR